MITWLALYTVIRTIGSITAQPQSTTFDNNNLEPKILISVRPDYQFEMPTDIGGNQQRTTGYEPKDARDISIGQAMISDAGVSGGIDSGASGVAVPTFMKANGDSDQMVTDVSGPIHSSSSIATARSLAGGDSVAVKRRLVEVLRLSPTKDELYQELTEVNAKLLNSEGETQKVKAIMSAKCNATISTLMQGFRAAAGQFQTLSQEIFQSEEHTSKTVLEQRMQEASMLLDRQSVAHEEQAVQFKQYTENLENHANAEFAMFKQASDVRMEHALAEQKTKFQHYEFEKNREDARMFQEKQHPFTRRANSESAPSQLSRPLCRRTRREKAVFSIRTLSSHAAKKKTWSSSIILKFEKVSWLM